jgi:hypothetical protein
VFLCSLPPACPPQVFTQLVHEDGQGLDMPGDEDEPGVPSKKLYCCHFIMFMLHPAILECACMLDEQVVREPCFMGAPPQDCPVDYKDPDAS